MQRVVGSVAAVLRGPAGGMLACLLLAGMLGGIAMANPDAIRGSESSSARGGGSHGGGTALHDGHDGDTPHGGGQGDAVGHGDVNGSGSDPGGSEHTPAGCRAIVRHLNGDLRQGDHGGLVHAVGVVTRTCRRHTDAPGLLRALDHLAENLQRWEAKHGDGPGRSADRRNDDHRSFGQGGAGRSDAGTNAGNDRSGTKRSSSGSAQTGGSSSGGAKASRSGGNDNGGTSGHGQR